MVIHRNELVERITANMVALVPFPASVPQIPPEPASETNITDKNSKETTWLFLGISDHCRKVDCHLEFLLNCDPDFVTRWDPRNNV